MKLPISPDPNINAYHTYARKSLEAHLDRNQSREKITKLLSASIIVY
jgi:hypothetical protein